MTDGAISTSIDAALARQYHEGRLHLATEILLPAAVKEHDRCAALTVLNMCGEAVRDRVALPENISAWLADVLTKISQGDSIDEACGIPARRRGSKKEGQARADSGRRFMMAYHFGVKHEYERMKELPAQMEVAAMFNRDRETVESAWKKHRTAVRREIALEVEYFGAPWTVRNRDKG